MIKRTNKIVRNQITIYIEDWQLELIDAEAKDNELSRSMLMSKVLTHHYPKPNDTNKMEEQKQNGTGTIERNNDNGNASNRIW